MELPPRARRIRRRRGWWGCWWGTTSACAENTPAADHCGEVVGNYLRVRGEYAAELLKLSTQKELPPRARRIRVLYLHRRPRPGTTSACAENTKPIMHHAGQGWNYLRVRGEYPRRVQAQRQDTELPPRARRIHRRRTRLRHQHGTTSACAENTNDTHYAQRSSWNYLRVRGEYMPPTPAVTGFLELPPRARRILYAPLPTSVCLGTTSACAENTACYAGVWEVPWNYLRVRGEYGRLLSLVGSLLELPPRARRIP